MCGENYVDHKMSRKPPLLSIVTIAYNALDGLRSTSDSLPCALPPWCEWVVVDGGSTDGTVDFLTANSDKITRSISERDNGIANAFNKGIALCKGRYVLFLNAGDCLIEGALGEIVKLLSESNSPVIVGRIQMNGHEYGRAVSFKRQWMRNYLPHQAMLIKRGLFRLLGGYDESYRLGMDFEWSLRLKPFWQHISFSPSVLAKMEPGGVSITQYKNTFDQYHKARQKHCGYTLLSWGMSEFFKAKVWVGRYVRRIFIVYSK
jgi:glycosyltransferase involved in cell wall biosynthesis